MTAAILDKIRWRKDLDQRGYERNLMSPELAEALRREIRTALEAEGGPFDINVARRVYDLAIAARDMCVAATSSVKEAISQIKETNGPMESLDSADTPESQVQASESFGARLLRELMATLPLLRQPREGDDPKQLVHALAEARRNGMHDVAEQIEVKLFGRVLSGPRPIATEEVEVVEGSFEHGFADGRTGALPVSEEGEYHAGYLKGTTAKYLDPRGDDPPLCEACQKYPRPTGTPCYDCREIARTQASARAGARKFARPPSGMENASDQDFDPSTNGAMP